MHACIVINVFCFHFSFIQQQIATIIISSKTNKQNKTRNQSNYDFISYLALQMNVFAVEIFVETPNWLAKFAILKQKYTTDLEENLSNS